MNLAEIARLAAAATSGPWTVDVDEDLYPGGEIECRSISIPEIERCLFDSEWAAETDWPRDLANAQFIAAVSPDVVLQLVAVARAAREAYQRLDVLEHFVKSDMPTALLAPLARLLAPLTDAPAGEGES